MPVIVWLAIFTVPGLAWVGFVWLGGLTYRAIERRRVRREVAHVRVLDREREAMRQAS